MAGRRRCRICWKLFLPDPRLGKRQRACGSKDCQQKRHARNCADSRRRDPEHTRTEERVLKRIVKEPVSGGEESPHPLDGVDWDAVREETGTATMVVLRETERLVYEAALKPPRRGPKGAG